VDPTGEWVAWSYKDMVYLHGMRGSSHTPAIAVRMPNEFYSVEFCDWTADSRLLVNLQGKNGTWVLALVETTGQFIRTIPTTMPPAPASVAAYRKYERR
jgi:hypothetical protein